MSKKRNKGTIPKKAIKHNFNGELSLVIPCYNESRRIDNLLKKLKDFDRKWEAGLEIIIVDDGSTDNSVKKIEAAFPGAFTGDTVFKFIKLQKNQGKGAALKAGVAQAGGDFILTLDADMATSPHELHNWLNTLDGKNFSTQEILIGSREHENSKIKGQVLRRFAGLVFNFIIQLFTNLNITDTQCGFKLYPAAVAKNLFAKLKTDGWAHDVELLYQAKLEDISIRTMPVKWIHQEDSKISLFSDSIKMLFQTMLISTRLNWQWFVVQPIRDLKNKTSGSVEPSWYRFLFVSLVLLLLFLMPYLSFDFGITGDEHLQKEYGELILKHFETNGTYKNKDGENALNYKNLYYYGGLFDYVAAWLNEHVGGLDVYEMRHLLNAFVGFLMILFTGLLAKEVSNSWRVAFFALIFMALSPRIFGHSMNNPKDIPFAAAYVFTLLYLIRFLKQLPRPGSKTVIMLIIGIAASINVRVGGILLIAYFGLFLGMSYLIRPELRAKLSDAKHLGKISLIALVSVVLAFFGGMLFWPYAREAPFSNPFQALSEMSNFSTSIRMLFEGAHLWSDELPWYYIPKWISISAPLFALVGLIAFVVFFILKFRNINYLPLLFIFFTAIFPVSYAVFKGSSLYDGMRHFLFIYPILICLAAWAWNQLILLPKMRWVASGSLILLLLLPGYWMVKNHPYQYTYFNEIFGGTSAAYGFYETDYWMNSIKGLCEWLAENEERVINGEAVTVHTNCYVPANHYLKQLAPNVNVGYTRYNDRHKVEGDYYMFISRFVNKDLIQNGAWPPANIIHTEKAGNAIIGAISKRSPELYDYQAAQAEKTRNFDEAIRFYQLEVEQQPKNENAWFGMANSFMQKGDFVGAKPAIDGFLNLTQTHVNGLTALGVYYLNTGDTEQAKATFERVAELNYKYNASYFYLAPIYARENQADKALKTIEMYDEVGGNSINLYDLAIQITQQQNKKGAELYFKAKKAYHQQDGGSAYQLVKQALTVNPDYEPAVKLNEAFEEMLAKQNNE